MSNPPPHENLFSHFQQQLQVRPEKEMLITAGGRNLTASWLDRTSGRLAACLSELGVRQGDRVSVQVEKSPENLCLYLACLRAGVVYHPLNTGYQVDELGYLLTDAQPSLVVCDPRSRETMERLASATGRGRVLTLDGNAAGSLISEAAEASEDFGIVGVEGRDLAALLYSSGTTGRPKGVMLSHANLLVNARALVATWEFDRNDRLLHALPIFHVHGLFVAIGCALLSGASMRWLPKFEVRDVLRFLPECTVMMGVPTYYSRLLAESGLTREVCDHMRLFVSGSAPLREETFRHFEARTGHRILERYGMTETNMNTSNPLDGLRKPGTVGLPLQGVELRVVDAQGRPVAVGETGNIEVRGPNVFAGYWRLPEKTAVEFRDDGFFRTGDQGRIDEDGYVSIVGRSRDMIITGGLNVYPREVEQIIDRLPGVSESAVIGVPHADLGEAVVAVVVPESGSVPDEEGLIALVRSRVAGFKVPKRVVFIDVLPRNTMAKVQKGALRDRYRDVCPG